MRQNQSLILEIRAIIANAKNVALRAIENERIIMSWNIGKRIFEE
jgi:hypothetical protein